MVPFLLNAGDVLPDAEMETKHPNVDPLDRERRYLPTNAQTEAFIQAMQAAPAADRPRQPAATVWTTYLDTEDLRCFLSCDGPIARRLRVREYEGVSDGGSEPLCHLELKQTAGARRSKVRLSAPVAMLAQLIEGVAGTDAFFTGTDRETHGVALRALRDALADGHFVPCVGTSYRRRCLAASPELRVTLDEDLTFLHPVSLGPPHDNGEAVALGPPRVLEVKYAGPLPGWLARALQPLNEAPQFSKFRLGMLAVQQAAQIAAAPASRFHRSPFTGLPAAAPRNTLRPSAAL
jgi:hypothetical protein